MTTLFPLRAHDDIRVEISKWQAGHSARKRCFSDNSGAFWLMVIQPSVEGEDGDHEDARADGRDDELDGRLGVGLALGRRAVVVPES